MTREGGPRQNLIPDFLIAAHASVQADRLAAMDRGDLRTDFPHLAGLSPAWRFPQSIHHGTKFTDHTGVTRIEKTVPGRLGIDTFRVGMDTGTPIYNPIQPPFTFTGTIHEVRVGLKSLNHN